MASQVQGFVPVQLHSKDLNGNADSQNSGYLQVYHHLVPSYRDRIEGEEPNSEHYPLNGHYFEQFIGGETNEYPASSSSSEGSRSSSSTPILRANFYYSNDNNNNNWLRHSPCDQDDKDSKMAMDKRNRDIGVKQGNSTNQRPRKCNNSNTNRNRRTDDTRLTRTNDPNPSGSSLYKPFFQNFPPHCLSHNGGSSGDHHGATIFYGNHDKYARYHHNQQQQQQQQQQGGGTPRQTRNHNNGIDAMERTAHGLMERFRSRVHVMRVNPNPADLLNGGPWDQLNQAIWDVFTNKIQKEETYINKLEFWKSVFLFIRTTSLHNCGLFLVGSTMSGFGLENSDIDMCLLTKPLVTDARLDALGQLNHLKNLMIKSGMASEAELIMAKVPILKFKNKETGFEVDLNCNNGVGIWNTHLLHLYGRLDWRVRPLVVIVKLWAKANRINDAKNMTVSSYSWALMVIHYLQCGASPSVLPCLHTLYPDKFKSEYEHTAHHHNMDVQEDLDFVNEYASDNTSCLGDLLIGFLHYYTYFDYGECAISVRTGTCLSVDECKASKFPKNDPNQWRYLCIEEPFDFSNTAKSVYDQNAFKHIRHVIASSYRELTRNKTLNFILPVNLCHKR